jgi:aspartate kinase
MIIMKFGGTSIRDAVAFKNVTQIVHDNISKNPVVVLSAMAGVTDLLEEAVQAAVNQDLNDLTNIFSKIENLHLDTARDLFSSQNILTDLEKSIHEELHSLLTLLNATKTIRIESEDIVHAILSTGEIMSSAILFTLLNESNDKVESFDVRKIMITRKEHGEILPDLEEIEKRASDYLLPVVKENDIVVTQGFIALSADGAPTTLGRNGSDHSASLIGAALHAEEIQIWTDVDGILTADPTIIKDARLLKHMTFEEACELAYFGARVLHPASIQPALARGIPVRVLNSHFPDESGTLVVSERNVNDVDVIKSVVYKEGITLLTLESSNMLLSPRIMGEFFQHLSEHGKRVYLVSKSATKLTLTIESRKDLHHLLNKIDHIGEISIERNKAIMSVVGEGIKNNPVLIWKIIKKLSEHNINLELISQVASQISFMFIIDEKDIEQTVQIIHEEFINVSSL